MQKVLVADIERDIQTLIEQACQRVLKNKCQQLMAQFLTKF